MIPVYDFCFITFGQIDNKPNFGACYVVKATAAGQKTYGLWHSVAINTFYDDYCGKETEDYYALSQEQNPKYHVISIEGEGKGTEIYY